MTNLILLGINRYGEEVYDWLTRREDANVLCIVTEESQYETIKNLKPDLLISAGFKNIVPDNILQIPDLGAVNLHPSYLPYNKGYNPSVWSMIENTPAGVTIHYMSEELDSGPIIERKKVPINPADDGRTMYEKLESALVDLFKKNWNNIRRGQANTKEQKRQKGNHHYKKEFLELCELDLEESLKTGEFIDRLRALTFEPYNNAYFKKDGERYYVSIDITPESKTESGQIHWNLPEYDKDTD